MSIRELVAPKAESLASCPRTTSYVGPGVIEGANGEELLRLRQDDPGLAATFENAGIGIAEVDADGKLRRVNAWLAGLLGRSPEELLGRSIFDPDLVDDAGVDYAQFHRQVSGEIDRYNVEKCFRRKDGTDLWVSISSSSVRNAEGRFLYAVRIQHDVTDRKRAEEALARRAEEQAALYEFTEGLQHIGTLEDAFEQALDAIKRALHCDRAAVLLHDAAGVMRFVAWRGLSQSYRRAVEGHSPWSADARHPESVSIEDIEQADVSASLKATISAEGIGALSFIPILGDGRLIGKFMTYYAGRHVFAEAENALALTIARQLGHAVVRMRTEIARREAEGALRDSETRKTAILQSAVDGIITMDQDGRIIDFNPAAEAILRRRKEEVVGSTVLETMVPERLRDAHRRGLKRFLESGTGKVIGSRLHVPALRGDGSEFEAELSVAAARLENGEVFFTGYLRDITEAKWAERAAQRLVAIVESSHDAIVSKDLNGIIQTWNGGAERVFGYKAEEVIGKPITIVIPPDRRDEEPAILARIRNGERVDHFETVRQRKDGSLIDVSLTISPVRDKEGRIIGASKIARDISERKEAEVKLRDSERQLKDLLAAIPAAIYTTDAQGRITYFNEKAVEFAGRTPTLGADEWCVTWKLYRPDGTALPHDQCPMAIALKEGRPIRNAEAIAERPDGTRVPFIPYPTPLRDWKGNIIGAVNMLVDVSERKQAETQQRILFNELNHRVKNNMQTLQSLLHLAGKKTRSVEAQKVLEEASGRVAAMAAAQQVLYATTDATRFEAQEFLDAVCRTAERTFSKDMQIVCEAGDIQLANDVAMPLALILNELLTNAVKHGVDESGTGVVRVGLQREEDAFVLYVEDEGPGFDLATVRQRSSGLQLVEGLARQLRGKFHVTKNPRTRCIVHFSS
jgi:PAS domain S-box-containing protein